MSGNDSELSEAEKMRLKRLARLGGPPTQPVQQAQLAEQLPAQEATAPANSGPSRLLATALPPASATPQAPQSSSAQPMQRTTSPSKPITPTPRAASSSLKRPLESSRSQTPNAPRTVSTPAASAPPTQPYAKWEASKVATILAVTLDKQEAEANDWKLCWLKGLAGEMSEEGVSKPAVSFDIRDRLLIARLSLDTEAMATSNDSDILMVLASMPKDETVFEYLTGCWKRLYAASREFSRLNYGPEDKTKWQSAFGELKRLIISYCGMTLEDPSMFPQPQGRALGPAEFLPLLLAVTPDVATSSGDPYTSAGAEPVAPKGALSSDDLIPFLQDLTTAFPDGTFADVITPTLSLFFQEWFKITPTPDLLGSEWRKYLGAVMLLVQVKAIATLLPTLPIWVAPSVSAPKIEWQSLLGPLTRLSVFPREFPQIWKTYFSNPTDRKTADIDANKSNLRQMLGGLQSSLFSTYNAIVRSSPDAREGILDFFALILKLNEKRSGMRVDYRTVSSDGFLINIQAVLLKLFEPVMDVSFSKIDKVDTDYYRHSKRIDVLEETKIRGGKEEVDEYYSASMETDNKPNFISDLFFLLNAFQHLGLIKTIGTRGQGEKNIGEMEKELKRLEGSQAEWESNPMNKAQAEAAITKLKSDIATLHAHLHVYDVQLQDPAFTRLNVTFSGFLMNWLLRLVDPKHLHPAQLVSLPLPAEAPQNFRMLPEYLFDNVVEYYDFLSRYNPDVLDNSDKDILITFAITFLTPNYINNPYLKAKLVAILANGLYPQGYHRRGFLFDRLSVLSMSTDHLMPTLIRFWIDVESTGTHTQFWDKFNYRRDMSRIIKSMWTNPLHREAFVKSRHDDFEQFIKFVHMLLSDTTFHLEESLTSLASIHSLRAKKEDENEWAALDESERTDLESALRQAESVAPYHTAMGRDHIELIRDITATAKEPFLAGEIVDRLAASLDENLTNLVGPKMQELKLADPERFSFKPKELLAGIAQIYLNLGQEPDFIRAVANDGRGYSKEVFEKFGRILKNRAIMTDAEVAGIMSFAQRVEDMKATITIEDEREIPDEFLDPLLASLMKDPVILPVSRVTVDRSTIRAVLLSGDKDPFNNVPLKYEDCIPDTELKAKIDAWVEEGKGPKAADVMDVDEL